MYELMRCVSPVPKLGRLQYNARLTQEAEMFVDWVKVGFISGLMFVCAVSASHADTPATRDALILQNTAPVGIVDVAGGSTAPVAAATMSAEDRYKASCAACHDSGAAGAPKLGVKALWAARLAEGEETLVQHAIKGYNAMPAKGLCPTCSDDEIRGVVEYMISKAK
jgi:cytochrome c5